MDVWLTIRLYRRFVAPHRLVDSPVIEDIYPIAVCENCPVNCGETRCIELMAEINQEGNTKYRVVYCPSCESLFKIRFIQ